MLFWSITRKVTTIGNGTRTKPYIIKYTQPKLYKRLNAHYNRRSADSLLVIARRNNFHNADKIQICFFRKASLISGRFNFRIINVNFVVTIRAEYF